MIKVEEFYEDMTWDIDAGSWYHSIDGKRLVEYINEFISEHPDIEVVDIKYWVLQHDDGEDESRALLIYKEKGK